MVNQAKLHWYTSARQYKYRYEVPHNYEDTVQINWLNNNTKNLELDSVHDHKVFIDDGSSILTGYCKICVSLFFNVKHDGQHEACWVANGHITEVPLESVHSSKT
jgi:hypothetical protein